MQSSVSTLIYCLRHSSIVRALLLNKPVRVVASLRNTSVAMIERTYSKYITEYSDDIYRDALLQDEPPIGDNIVALASYRQKGLYDSLHPPARRSSAYCR